MVSEKGLDLLSISFLHMDNANLSLDKIILHNTFNCNKIREYKIKMKDLMYVKKLLPSESFNQNLEDMVKSVGGKVWYEDEWLLQDIDYRYKDFHNKK